MGTGEGVGDGVGVGTDPCGWTAYPAKLGGWKSATFMPPVALAMKSCQISAGIDPQNTSGKPSTLSIGLSSVLG